MPRIARSPNHRYLKGTTYSFRHVVPNALRHSLGRSEIRMSLRPGYLAEARPKARILASGVKQVLTRIQAGELPMDDFDRIKLFLLDFLERFLKENEQIPINNLTPPNPILQYVPGKTEELIDHLKGLLVSRDYDTMREYMVLAAEGDVFGPP